VRLWLGAWRGDCRLSSRTGGGGWHNHTNGAGRKRGAAHAAPTNAAPTNAATAHAAAAAALAGTAVAPSPRTICGWLGPKG